MTLGLPGHLVQSELARALARAAHGFGLICLTGALGAVIVLSATEAGTTLPITIAVMLAMAGLLVLVTRRRSLLMSLSYLIIGTLCIYVFTDTVLSAPESFSASTLFLLALPKMALVMVAGAGSGLLVGVLWSTAGFVLAEAAGLLAVVHADVSVGRDFFTVTAYVALTVALLLAGLGHRRGALAQPALLRAARNDASSQLRHSLDNRSIAVLNDTVINQLVGLSLSSPGVVSPHLQAGLRTTLHTLRDTAWLSEGDPHAPGTGVLAASALFAAVDRCRTAGLTIEVNGDIDSLDRLTSSADRELALAVEQCLGNVLRHAGTIAAEVSVENDSESVSIMVADAGRGFTLSGSGSGRLGLRQSVRRRIDRLGGSVTIWTRPGAGTTVRLTVPAGDLAVPAPTVRGRQ
ncbi:ATP-binding protein [Cryobacterium sp. CG_9.6]|uniref:ATP-binding protein n=1 Tax=Cryobacterium sp. CG_9.6 TaxID=2760710 RepID=UPI002473B713|nr:ATP-binding protein [Cryobacterium sp. CG_9.6]MDH6235788.1 signal transduction histidine kinase [Cryobacterium sp. CG_9.6]